MTERHLSIVEIVALAENRNGIASKAAEVAHIESCADCRSLAEGFVALRKALASLPAPEPPLAAPREEIELLAEAIVARAERNRRTKKRRLAALLVGALVALTAALVVLSWAFGGRSNVLEPPTPAPPATSERGPASPAETSSQSGPQPAFVAKGRSFSDAKDAEAAIKGDPTIAAFQEYYTAAQVGANLPQMQEAIGQMAQSQKVAGRSPAECMNAVLRAVPRPILPAYLERARYQGRDSWLFVFVYAPDSNPSTRLSETIFYAMAVEDCTFLGTASWEHSSS